MRNSKFSLSFCYSLIEPSFATIYIPRAFRSARPQRCGFNHVRTATQQWSFRRYAMSDSAAQTQPIDISKVKSFWELTVNDAKHNPMPMKQFEGKVRCHEKHSFAYCNWVYCHYNYLLSFTFFNDGVFFLVNIFLLTPRPDMSSSLCIS